MAKAYRAISRIQHGEEVDDGQGNIVNRMHDIPVGAKVEGLPSDIMANLWEAGALEEFEDTAPTATVRDTPRPAPQTDSTGDGAANTPDAPPAE